MVTLDVQVAEIAAAEAFDGVQSLGVVAAAVVQPAFVVEAAGVHHEPVVIPVPDRIVQPSRIRHRRMSVPVGEDLAEARELLVENQREAGVLQDFHWHADQHLVGDAVGQAASRGPVRHVVGMALFVNRCGGGQHGRDGFAGPHEILEIRPHGEPGGIHPLVGAAHALPQPAEIGLAIRRPRDPGVGYWSLLRGRGGGCQNGNGSPEHSFYIVL